MISISNTTSKLWNYGGVETLKLERVVNDIKEIKRLPCELTSIILQCDDYIVVSQGCENLAKREACNRPVSYKIFKFFRNPSD